MNTSIMNNTSVSAAVIDSQQLLKMVNDARKQSGEPEIRNNKFIEKIEDELEGDGYTKSATVPQGGGTPMTVITMTYRQALRVAARESKAVRRSLVEKLETMQQQLQTTTHQASNGPGELRRARAMEITVNTAKTLLDILPHLSPEAKQAMAASLINPVAGYEVIRLPAITEHYYTAGEVGKRYGISANKVGRIANAHCLKTDAYGRWFIDKSAHSDRQVQTFRYNDAGIQKIGDIIGSVQATVSAH
ncbi:TPA: hypothetical protein U0D20_004687 [Escherichia coli]|nr:hypothetical protein [Escherichia coli]HEL8385949.1 hypothetical protein [Escherichia coli]HEM0058810.1 hypothetical protein [Escherichia coli]HEM0087235.1 hypothetical protein [Escherichia coli]